MLITAELLSYARAVCTSDDIFDGYYDMPEATLTDNGLVGKLMQVFNMVETGISLMKFLNTYGDVPGTAYALSGSSWINAKIFG